MTRFLILPVLALTACTEIQMAVDNTAREGTKGVVAETLAIHFPQVPKQLITPFTNCVIDNASAVELRDLARSALSGVDEMTVLTVRNTLARPETQSCLRSKTLA